MKMTDLYAAQLEREAKVTRRAVEAVPEGRPDWKPHEKSMPLGTLANLVGTMPGWIAMIVGMDELDIAPVGGAGEKPKVPATTRELLAAHDESVVKAREALRATNDEHLQKPWKLLVGGKTVMESPRHVVIEDAFAHLAHHRGQLTVYLRMNDAPVPAIYGPSADDARFD
jgi:uncharacterized damage-inducible protein DinB